MGNAAGCLSASAEKHKHNYKHKKHSAKERYRVREEMKRGVNHEPAYVSSVPDSILGAFSITVVEARSLPRHIHSSKKSQFKNSQGVKETKPITSTSSFDNPESNPDPLSPFVVVSFGSASFETQVIANDHPVWEQTHHLLVRNGDTKFPLKIELFNISSLSRYQLLGGSELKASDFLDEKPHDIWVELQEVENVGAHRRNKSKYNAKIHSCGEVRLRLELVPIRTLENIFWGNFADVYDWDRNRVVSHLELRLLLEGLGSSMSDESVDKLIEKWMSENPNKGSEIPIDEIAGIMSHSTEQHLIHMTRCPICSQPISKKSRSQKINPAGNSLIHSHDSSREKEGMHWGKDQWSDLKPTGKYGNVGSSASGTMLDSSEDGRLTSSESAPELTEDIDIIVHVANCIKSHQNIGFSVSGGFLWDVVEYKGWLAKMVGWSAHEHPVKQDTGSLVVQDRETGSLIEERVPPYEKIALRALYSVTAGGREGDPLDIIRRITTQVGAKFDEPTSRKHIQPFMSFYGIDGTDFLENAESFPSFNAFFHRKLRPHSRPIASPYNPRIAVVPCDSRVLVFDDFDRAKKVWVKGQEITLARLLQSEELAREYDNGALAMFRLGPQDCHRFFIPITGTLGETRVIEGEYCPTNPIAMREGVPVSMVNKRTITMLNSVEFGTVIYIVVGAAMLGSIDITSKAGEKVKKGDEHGFFSFGGSLVMLLFRRNSIVFADDFLSSSGKSMPIEVFAKMGTPLAVAKQE